MKSGLEEARQLMVSWQDIERWPYVPCVLVSHIHYINRSFKQASSRWRWRWTRRWGRGRRGGTTAWAAAMLLPLFSTSFLSLASAFMLVVIVTIIDKIVLNFHGTNQIVGKNLKIVAQWWPLRESHLLRLYTGVFQPSVVLISLFSQSMMRPNAKQSHEAKLRYTLLFFILALGIIINPQL